MWSCPFCGNHNGIRFQDSNLKGMLCMHPDCGRFDELDEAVFNQLLEEDSQANAPV